MACLVHYAVRWTGAPAGSEKKGVFSSSLEALSRKDRPLPHINSQIRAYKRVYPMMVYMSRCLYQLGFVLFWLSITFMKVAGTACCSIAQNMMSRLFFPLHG